MKRVNEIPTIYAKTNTNEKECDLVQDLGGNKFQICRKPESILKKSSQSYPEFIPTKSINYSSNNTFGNATNIQIPLGGRDPWLQSSDSLTYKPTVCHVQQFSVETWECEKAECLRLGEEKYYIRIEVVNALLKVNQGLLNILSPLENIREVTLEYLKNGFIDSIKSNDGITDISMYGVVYTARGALYGMGVGIGLGGNPYITGCLTVLGGIAGAIRGGLIGIKEVGVYGGAEAVGEVLKAQEKIKELNQNMQLQKKEVIQPKPVQSQTIHQSSTLTPSFKKEVNSIQEQEKQKSDRWAKNYMDSLVNQGGSDSSHPAYYLFSNAHSYALSKSVDTSKTFFAHYMDSLVNQGASNPQNPHYYMFSNAYAYALKNQ
jgi:hypothetical protein